MARVALLTDEQVDRRVASWLRSGPATLADLRTFTALHVNAIVRSLRRLKYRGKARCNVSRPSTAWHLTDSCPCCKRKDPPHAR